MVDLYGGPFPLALERKVVGGAVGYRVGGVDLALRLEHAEDDSFPVSSGEIETPRRTLVGVEGAAAFGSVRAPWWAEAAVGAAWVGRSDRVFFGDGNSEFQGGPRLAETHAVVSLTRYARVANGPLTVFVGGGAYTGLRWSAAETTAYRAGRPDEETLRQRARVDRSSGFSLAVPVAFRLSERSTLTVEPEGRIGTPFYYIPFPSAHLAVRLSL